jgi:hypothetical protein
MTRQPNPSLYERKQANPKMRRLIEQKTFREQAKSREYLSFSVAKKQIDAKK